MLISSGCISSFRLNHNVSALGRFFFATVSDGIISSEHGTSWAWVPPKQAPSIGIEDCEFTSTLKDNDVIPVKMRTLLSSKEIVVALTKMGAMDVQSVPLLRPLDNINEFIIASGSSTRHIRKMSDAIVQALKSRKIKKAMGYKGAEGEHNDDWLLVDCYDKVVHFMLPETRKALNLEEHWAENSEQPVAAYHDKKTEYEIGFEKLLEDYPVPDGWNNGSNAVKEHSSTKATNKKGTKIEYL